MVWSAGGACTSTGTPKSVISMVELGGTGRGAEREPASIARCIFTTRSSSLIHTSAGTVPNFDSSSRWLAAESGSLAATLA